MVQDGAAEPTAERRAFRLTLYRVLLIQLVALGFLGLLEYLYH